MSCTEKKIIIRGQNAIGEPTKMYVFLSDKYNAAIIVRRTLTTTKNINIYRTIGAKIIKTFKQNVLNRRLKYYYLVQSEIGISFDAIKQIATEVEQFEQERN